MDAYIADPLCDVPATVQLWVDLLDALGDGSSRALPARIPKRLPIYVIAGDRDPVSAKTASLRQLLSAYEAAGLQNVMHRFYPGARHELFNETSRDEVVQDLLAWIAHAVKRA